MYKLTKRISYININIQVLPTILPIYINIKYNLEYQAMSLKNISTGTTKKEDIGNFSYIFYWSKTLKSTYYRPHTILSAVLYRYYLTDLL